MPPSSLPLGFCSFCLEHPSDEISVLNSHKFSNDHLTLLFLWETLPHRLSNTTPQPLKPKIPLSASLVVWLLLAGATIKMSLFPSCPGKQPLSGINHLQSKLALTLLDFGILATKSFSNVILLYSKVTRSFSLVQHSISK